MFQFKIKYYDGEEVVEQGFVYGHDYEEAVRFLLEYYDEDNLFEISLSYVNERGILIIPQNCNINEIKSLNEF